MAALVSPLVGLWGEQTAMPMAGTMVGSIALSILAFVTLTRPEKAPRRPESALA